MPGMISQITDAFAKSRENDVEPKAILLSTAKLKALSAELFMPTKVMDFPTPDQILGLTILTSEDQLLKLA